MKRVGIMLSRHRYLALTAAALLVAAIAVAAFSGAAFSYEAADPNNTFAVFGETLTTGSIAEAHPKEHNGLLKNMSNEPLPGTFAVGAASIYRFTVTFPSSRDDTFQGSSLTCGFDWNETQT